MNKSILFAAVTAMVSLSSGTAYAAANTSTATANASSSIIQPITIANNSDLAFGRIVKPSTGSGSVTISDSADGVTAASGAVALTGVTTSRAKFTINGEGAQAISISVPATMEMKNGSDTITVNLDPDLGASETLSGSFGSAGSLNLNVGGNFNLGSGVASGAYTGSFDVTVAYQ